MTLVRLFHEGGVTMFWIAWLGPVALAFAIVHVTIAKRWAFITAAILLLLIAGSAIFGTLRGRSLVDNAVGMVGGDAELAGRIRDQGYAEAMRPVQFAAVVIVLAAIPLVIGEVRRRRRAA